MTVARTVGRNTVFAALARISVLGVWFVATPFVLSRLGTDRFGFWSILLVFGGSLATVDLGLGVAATRFVARLEARGGAREMLSLLRRAAFLQGAVALVLAIALVLAAPAILRAFHVPGTWQGEARIALGLSLAAFVITSLANLFLAGLQGLQRMDLAFRVAAPGAIALAFGVFWGTTQEQPLVALTAVQLGYSALTAVAFGAVLFRQVAREFPAAQPDVPGEHVPLRDLLALGGWVQVNSILGLVQAHVDKVILGTLVALAPVASYELGARVTLAAMLPPVLFLGALLPAFSHQASDETVEVPIALYTAALAPHFAMSLGIAGALVALAPWVLGAWLQQPPSGAVLCLMALAVAQSGHLLTGVSSTIARARGGVHLEFVYAILGTALHVAFALLGLRLAGVPGLLVGTMLSSLVAAAWFILRIETWLGASARGVAWSQGAPFFAAMLAAGAAGYLAAQGLNPSGSGGGAWSGLAVGGITYASVFVAAIRFGSPGTWSRLVARARRLRGADA